MDAICSAHIASESMFWSKRFLSTPRCPKNPMELMVFNMLRERTGNSGFGLDVCLAFALHPFPMDNSRSATLPFVEGQMRSVSQIAALAGLLKYSPPSQY